MTTKSAKLLTNRTVLTKERLDRLSVPQGKKEVWAWDTKCPGMAFRKQASGRGAFYLYRRVGGKPQKFRIGGREITIEQARKAFAKLNGEIANGNDPGAKKKETRESETLQELWDRYCTNHLEPHARKRTQITHKSRFETCLVDLAEKKVLSITREDVEALHLDMGKKVGEVSANRAVQLLRRVLNWAKMSPNPASRAVTMFKETERLRYVQPEELPKLFAAIDSPEVNPMIRDFLYVSLFTGARRSNVCAMRVEHINLSGATWTIPASESKNHEAMTIPLPQQAMAIIKRRLGHPSGFIFPSHGASGHLEEPSKAWQAIRKDAGLEDVRLHDLRRTFGSFQAAKGTSLLVVGKSLGHTDTASTAIYARLQLDPVRASVSSAVDAIVAAGRPALKAAN